MYLFDKNGDRIEIYSMTPNKKKMEEYKEQEMSKISPKQRILKIETNTNDVPFKEPFDIASQKAMPIDICISNLTFCKQKTLRNEYHRLQVQKEAVANPDYAKKILEHYYLCHYATDEQLVRVFEFNEKQKRLNFIKYLILNSYYIKQSEHGKKKIIENIINIPESLYLLELLRFGHFNLLDNKDITEQLEVFNFSEYPIKTYTLHELEELGTFGINSDALGNALNKAKNSEGILERIRRK